MFAPTTVGAPGHVITISTFGSGPKPIINNNGVLHPHPTRSGETVSAGLLLYNAEYTEVQGLEIPNNNGGDQAEDLFGIYVLAEDTGKYHNHIYIEDNYVHHVNGGDRRQETGRHPLTRVLADQLQHRHVERRRSVLHGSRQKCNGDTHPAILSFPPRITAENFAGANVCGFLQW